MALPYNPFQYQQNFQTLYQQPNMNQQNILPPQQILTANGKPSIDALKMSPNSSALIEDTTQPVIWKCMSDGIGNVSACAYDVTPHKEPEQVAQDNLLLTVLDLSERIKKLEEMNNNGKYRNKPKSNDEQSINA